MIEAGDVKGRGIANVRSRGGEHRREEGAGYMERVRERWSMRFDHVEWEVVLQIAGLTKSRTGPASKSARQMTCERFIVDERQSQRMML